MKPADKLKRALEQENPLQVAGVINAYCALLAKQAGFKCLYLSGAGVANASFAKADLGLTHFKDVLEDARRITSSNELPLLVDIDTGFADEISLGKLCQQMITAGVAAIQIEDQVTAKRCGHREGKQLVPNKEMQQRILDCKHSIKHNELLIMARTDAYDVEGIDQAIQRAKDYQSAGADMIFAEAINSLQDYKKFTQQLAIPVLANITEFGKTPLFNTEELKGAGIKMVLYPLSAFRAMNKVALDIYQSIKQQGSQSAKLDTMQTRDELYKSLDYYTQEKNQR